MNMKKISNILWGIVLIVIGVLFALNAFEIIDINIFFDGWWTLFIIVPSTIGFLTERDKIGSLIGLLIGVFLLLCCRDLISFDMLWKMALPIIIIIIGCKLIFGSVFSSKAEKIAELNMKSNGEMKSGCATFSGQDMDFSGEIFTGAELNAVFGGIKCDLRNAVIEKDCVINATAIFGGIDLLLPDNINVKIKSNSIFGGISEKRHHNVNADFVTLYINGTCMFGGVDIK